MIINNTNKFSNDDRLELGDLYTEMYSQPKNDDKLLKEGYDYDVEAGAEVPEVEDEVIEPDAEFAYEAFTKRTADRPFPYIIKTRDRDGDVKMVDFVWLSEANIFDPKDERIPFVVAPNQSLEQYVLDSGSGVAEYEM
jgi:hypothetical protein